MLRTVGVRAAHRVERYAADPEGSNRCKRYPRRHRQVPAIIDVIFKVNYVWRFHFSPCAFAVDVIAISGATFARTSSAM